MSDGTQPVPGTSLTYGQRAVGLTFNPSGDNRVHQIKLLYGQIIDLLAKENPANGDTSMKGRILGRAINDAMGASMWAVKAVTFKE